MEGNDIQYVIDILMNVSDLLYQDNREYAYKMLALILGSLEKVIAEIEQQGIRSELCICLKDALQAMQEEDDVLLADILQYEIVERLQKLNA